ncbi:MBL fold metallo-hydrolase [Flavobacterium sp. ZT3R18]|uniref:ComEC/Rec2 family competence protein n=1 Tax=Flavobacterium sp. ZT3R18 TaxID=2594429 RepID=UPI001179ECDB|nr:MBL fold metallo-hydrolase [Flavobacterium sp. ZT3R18]TRX35107.1 MBL fold metallo-hydrolase [Flavobacterium sp. ZT3R18]
MKLSILEAGKGDCFILSWGEKNDFHIVIDSGVYGTYRFIKEKLRSIPSLVGIIVTHVDYDHIGGFFKLIQDTEAPIKINFPVFINTPELILFPEDNNLVNYNHGEEFSKILEANNLEKKGLYIGMNDTNKINIEGLELTIISPYKKVLDELCVKWTASLIRDNYISESANSDKVSTENKELKSSEEILNEKEIIHKWDDDLINSSSIAFIANYNGKKILFLADANPDLVCEELEKMGHTEASPLKVESVKLGHHGSKFNTTIDLLKRIKTNSFIISTNGTGPYYHPNRETIVRIAKYGRKLNEAINMDIYTNYELKKEDFITPEEEVLWKINITFKKELDI